MSSKLVECLENLPEKKGGTVQKGSPMHDATFRSLQVRLHQPYWLCHAGDCEHFFVVEHLRYVRSHGDILGARTLNLSTGRIIPRTRHCLASRSRPRSRHECWTPVERATRCPLCSRLLETSDWVKARSSSVTRVGDGWGPQVLRMLIKCRLYRFQSMSLGG